MPPAPSAPYRSDSCTPRQWQLCLVCAYVSKARRARKNDQQLQVPSSHAALLHTAFQISAATPCARPPYTIHEATSMDSTGGRGGASHPVIDCPSRNGRSYCTAHTASLLTQSPPLRRAILPICVCSSGRLQVRRTRKETLASPPPSCAPPCTWCQVLTRRRWVHSLGVDGVGLRHTQRHAALSMACDRSEEGGCGGNRNGARADFRWLSGQAG